MSRKPRFTQEELDFIKVNSLVMSPHDIAKALGRNYWAVHRHLHSMVGHRNHIFTANEDFVIRKMYGCCSAKAIATKLGVDENSIYNRIKKLGIKKNQGCK